MKKTILLLVAMLINFSVSAQRGITDPSVNYDAIQIKRGSARAVNFESTLENVLTILGKPDEQKEYYFEMDDEYGMRLVYGSTKIHTKNGVLYTFDIWTRDFEVGVEGVYLSVGDKISVISAFCPEYEDQLKDGYVSFYFQVEDYLWDTFLIIEFDPSDRSITRIMRYDP